MDKQAKTEPADSENHRTTQNDSYLKYLDQKKIIRIHNGIMIDSKNHFELIVYTGYICGVLPQFALVFSTCRQINLFVA